MLLYVVELHLQCKPTICVTMVTVQLAAAKFGGFKLKWRLHKINVKIYTLEAVTMSWDKTFQSSYYHAWVNKSLACDTLVCWVSY